MLEEDENDELTLNEVKKRKRVARLHEKEGDHAEEGFSRQGADHNESNNEINHFLTANPGSGVCREQ